MEAVRLEWDFAKILNCNSPTTILTSDGHGNYIIYISFISCIPFLIILIVINVLHQLISSFYRTIFNFKIIHSFRKTRLILTRLMIGQISVKVFIMLLKSQWKQETEPAAGYLKEK